MLVWFYTLTVKDFNCHVKITIFRLRGSEKKSSKNQC
jgi:hypothetical protein